MSRSRWALLCCALLAACGDEAPIPDEELALHIRSDVQEVELGQAFSLTVVRVWSKALVPEEWNDETLQPLVVRLETIERREDERHVEETRRFRAYAFSLEEIELSGPVLKARYRGGGTERIARGNSLTWRVRPTLDPGAPGPVELPGEPLEKPLSWMPWAAGGAALLAVAALLMWRSRKRRSQPERSVPAAPAVPEPTAHERALQRLRRLREQRPEGRAQIQAFHVEVSAAVRGYIEERFAVSAPEMTTEEFLAAPRTAIALLARHREGLAAFLDHCDLVKFARHASSPSDRAGLLDTAEEFVAETQRDEAQDSAPAAGSGAA